MLSAKISGEFKDSGISSLSIDTSRPSRDPYKLDVEQDKIRQALLVKQESK